MQFRCNAFLVVFALFPVSPGLLCAATPICLPDDTQTCLFLSSEATQELLPANNSYRDTIQLRLERIAVEEVGRVLRSIRITASKASNNQPIAFFSLKNPVQLQLGRWTLFQKSISENPDRNSNDRMTSIGDVRQWLSVYWDNGNGFVRLDGLALDADETL